jgi:hypothetical protein
MSEPTAEDIEAFVAKLIRDRPAQTPEQIEQAIEDYVATERAKGAAAESSYLGHVGSPAVKGLDY